MSKDFKIESQESSFDDFNQDVDVGVDRDSTFDEYSQIVPNDLSQDSGYDEFAQYETPSATQPARKRK